MRNKPKYHIALVWRSLDNVAGGVEKFSISLANEMVKRGHIVSFFTWDESDAVPFFDLDERVNWVKLELGDPKLAANWTVRAKRFFKLRASIKNASPDVILVFENGIFLVIRLFLFALSFRIVLAERNSPSKHTYLKNNSKILAFFGYYIASEVVFQFCRYKYFLPRFLQYKVVGLPNPVCGPPVGVSVSKIFKQDRKIILCIGRLAYQKNIGALIQAFVALADEYERWDLVIGGEGPEEAQLSNLVRQTGYSHRVFFVGSIENPHSYYSGAHIFCIPSLYEGFPNALAEALASGLPAVGFRNCCGVSDLIQDGVNGKLVEGDMTGERLKVGLEVLMSNSQLRSAMGRNASVSVSKFAPTPVYDSWEAFLLKSNCK